MSDMYEFQVKGLLNKRWSDWFGGLTIRHQDDGTTVLVGPVVDQAALYGVMVRIRDLGLPLLSVNAVDAEEASVRVATSVSGEQ